MVKVDQINELLGFAKIAMVVGYAVVGLRSCWSLCMTAKFQFGMSSATSWRTGTIVSHGVSRAGTGFDCAHTSVHDVVVPVLQSSCMLQADVSKSLGILKVLWLP